MSSDVKSPKNKVKVSLRLLPTFALVIYPPLQTYFLLSDGHIGMDNQVLSFFRLLFGISILYLSAISAKRLFDVFANK